jgi:hypothetical protein
MIAQKRGRWIAQLSTAVAAAATQVTMASHNQIVNQVFTPNATKSAV